jgi:enterochelin esterase-like enzyme
MGGYGTGRIGMSHPARFGTLSMLCAGPVDLEFQGARTTSNPELRDAIFSSVYGSDMSFFQHVSPWRTAERQARALAMAGTRMRMVIGGEDFTLADNEALHNHLDAIGVRHQYAVAPGVGHNVTGLMKTMGDGFWSFYRAALR